jgi:hypothetical protein
MGEIAHPHPSMRGGALTGPVTWPRDFVVGVIDGRWSTPDVMWRST